MEIWIQILVCLVISLVMAGFMGCSNDNQFTAKKTAKDTEDLSFMSIGSFAVNPLGDGYTEVRDGAGRTLILVPRGKDVPDGYEASQVVRIPVQRVVAYGSFDIAILKALGVVQEVLTGVVTKKEDWYVPEVIKGMEENRILFLGGYSAIDFEQMRKAEPELVLTWDMSILPMMDEMGVTTAITTTPVAMCLNARMKFVRFLAPFFQKEKQAKQYFEKVSKSLDTIREVTRDAKQQPKVMWGDIYEKRVLVEPGNAWVGELVELALSDYQFKDVFGKSCIEISLERFLYSGQDADIFFTYRSPDSGATSKAALARANPLLARVKPLKDGRVYSPLPHYSQSGDKLDEILTDIAAILHPECYPGHKLKYFRQLPDTDPKG
ncbi:MAG: ABC transporter substrate-binding protein [Deltaproteobacteria bacterium]|nr:MAG: ABC transporter substrate-binding protein [Deltaproteobacteria bacterium]